MLRAPVLVETFPNIKQQFEIDVDATDTHRLNDQKYLGLSFSVSWKNVLEHHVWNCKEHLIVSNLWVNYSEMFLLNRIMLCPEHVFPDRCFNFKTEGPTWYFLEGLYKSCKYSGQFSWKNSEALEQMHWLNLLKTGSQFICSNSFNSNSNSRVKFKFP